MQLSPRESQVLHLISGGYTYDMLSHGLGVTSENIHSVCFSIRRKTGIKSTKNKDECRNYIRWGRMGSRPEKKNPATAKQLEVLRLIAEGLTYRQIAERLRVKVQTVTNHAHDACRRIGRGGCAYSRREILREYFSEMDKKKAAEMAENPQSDPAF